MACLIPDNFEAEPPCTPRCAKMTIGKQWQETPPSTPRRKQSSLQEDPPCTPQLSETTIANQCQETPPSTPRRTQNSLDMAFLGTPPQLTVQRQNERLVEDDLMDAIDSNSMSALTLALNRQLLKTGSLIHACIHVKNASALRLVLRQTGMKHDLDKPCSMTHQCPLEFAFRPGQSDEIIDMLLVHGADPNATSSNGGGQRLLHKAAMSLNVSAVNLLLQHGADPCHVDDDSCTPLHSVCKAVTLFAFSPPCYRAIVAALLAYGANPLHRDSAGLLAEDYAPPVRAMPAVHWDIDALHKKKTIG